MKPGSFDPATARETIGDDRARVIEAKARTDADAGPFTPPPAVTTKTYWDGVKAEMEFVVYREQHVKRLARNARKTAA